MMKEKTCSECAELVAEGKEIDCVDCVNSIVDNRNEITTQKLKENQMTERTINIGTQKHTKVICIDEPSHGGACHDYLVIEDSVDEGQGLEHGRIFASVNFQEGPTKENKKNGCFDPDLLVILIDRLEHFQRGEYACARNAETLQYLYMALRSMASRTADRHARGVEGTSAK